MIKLHRVLMAGALLALASAPAQAADIMGGMSLAGVTVSKNGTDLLTSTIISSADTAATSTGTGDFSPTPLFTLFGANTVDLTLFATGFGFSFSNATYGSFMGESGVIVQQTADFISLYVLGTASKGALTGPASLRISINLTGGQLSEAITLNAPPVSVPEPTSVAMAGIGLAAAGLVGLRKRSV